MSQENGALKHIRAAALAAALVPLASVAATPAEAQGLCASGGLCGFVWSDTNGDGIQDSGEPGIAGASVTLHYPDATTPPFTVMTDEFGFYNFASGFVSPDTEPYTIAVQVPGGTAISPANVCCDDTIDSDGETDGNGNSVASVIYDGNENSNTDFGFVESGFPNPGTGTPGYWMNHPEAWPVAQIVVGGVPYSKAQAIAILQAPGNKDKTYTMFSSLVPAMLNVLLLNDPTCVSNTIAKAHEWMATYGPVGNDVRASSYAWKIGEPLHRILDNYNNGMLCAPHRD